MSNIGKNWWVWSKSDKEFEIIGYTKPGGCHTEDALRALQILSKYTKKPIPRDIQIKTINCDQ